MFAPLARFSRLARGVIKGSGAGIAETRKGRKTGSMTRLAIDRVKE
jgi:hypothetical protein